MARCLVIYLPDLKHTWKWVHDHHSSFSFSHQFGSNYKLATDTLIFLVTTETLSLYTSHIQHIRVWQGLLQTRIFRLQEERSGSDPLFRITFTIKKQ